MKKLIITSLLILLAGMLNGTMDAIAHSHWHSGIGWIDGTDKVTGWWMVGPLYVLKDAWHLLKQCMVFIFFIPVLMQVKEKHGFWFLVMALSWWIGFDLIYKGVLQ